MSIPRAITGISKADSALSHLSQPPVNLTVAADAPVASANALNFIKKITITDIKYTFFVDDLMTFTDLQSELGFYRASVKEGCYKGDDCFLVEAVSEGKVEGVPCSTEVRAYLDRSLETLHQELHESVRLEHGALDRRTVTELTQDGYKVHKEVTQGERKDVTERTFPRALMAGFVSEAANIVLQRILVSKGLPDYFEVVSFDSDTNLCQASYKDLAMTDIAVGAPAGLQPPTRVRCYGLERRVACVTDVPVTWHSYLLADGHLVSRAQVGSPVRMKVRAVPELVHHDEFLERPVVARARLDWRDDLQLARMFADRKDALASATRQFVRDHPELHALVADLLQALLAHKPDDPVLFARHFFATFSNRFVLGGPAQLHSDRPGLLLSSDAERRS